MRPADKTNIFAICDELNAKGIKPTLSRVRESLGGGSFTTIQPILKEWKEKRQEPEANATSEMPDDIKALVVSLGSQIWAKAEVKANEDYKELRDVMQAKLDEMSQEKQEASEEVARLEDENSKLAMRVKDIEKKMGDYEKSLGQAQIELKVQFEKLSEYDGLTQRHEKLLLEVGELRGRLAAALDAKSLKSWHGGKEAVKRFSDDLMSEEKYNST
ncbi:MAG: DNA-binding protein [Oligoflexus sp.]